MKRYIGTMVLNVSLFAGSDDKAQERLNLLAKSIDLAKLEASEEWIDSVDWESVDAEFEEDMGD